jgi:hypothetical protein
MQAGMKAGRQAGMQAGRQASMQASRHMQASIAVCCIEYEYHIVVCIAVRLIVVRIAVCCIEYEYHIVVCIAVRLIVVCRIESVLVWHDIVVFCNGP